MFYVFYRIPSSFFDRNEESYRGCVLPTIACVREEYKAVEAAVQELCHAVQTTFPACSDVVYDINNNIITFKEESSALKKSNEKQSVAAVDRFGKLIPRRLTTVEVTSALKEYVSCAEKATRAVKRALQSLSDTLLKDLGTIIQVD